MEESVADHQSQKVDVDGDGDDMMMGSNLSAPDLEGVDDKNDDKPTREELEEQVKVLKDENQELRKCLDMAKKMFGNEWSELEQQWKRKNELEELTREEDHLVERVEILKKTLCLRSNAIGIKLEEIQTLTTSLTDLEYGNVKQPVMPFLAQDEGVIGTETMMGRKDAEAIFPEEVWKMILGNVSDPRDLWNLCNTCHLFDTILSKWKTGWMLEQSLPHLYQHLPADKLLKCRLICKSWKGKFDSFLESHPSLLPHDPVNSDPRRLDFVNPMKEKWTGEGYEFRFSNSTDMTFLEDPSLIEKWKGNKIIGRAFTLYLGGSDDDYSEEEMEAVRRNKNEGFQQMWDKFCSFLDSFGKEIWHLNILYYLNEPNGPGDEWEQKMLPFLTSDVFRVFPNLKKLYIDYEDGTFDALPNPESLPPAPKLESFEFGCYRVDITTTIATRYHAQLRKLRLGATQWKGVKLLNWDNLQELYLLSQGRNDDFEELFDGGGVALPQLSKLGIDLGGMFNVVEIESLLRILRQLASISRLSTLRLEGGIPELHFGQWDGEGGGGYSLSGVKTLELEHCYPETDRDPVPKYDFLLRCFPLLVNLNLFIRNDARHFPSFEVPGPEFCLQSRKCDMMKKSFELGENGQEIVELNKFVCEGQMYRSNIWELMPLLNVFTFQWDVYTRGGYEAYKEKTHKC